MYKAIFIDIDGTLRNDEIMITKRTKEAIKQAIRYRNNDSYLFRKA